MTLPDIPTEVLQFIADKIDTVPQFEALLLLWESSPKEWSEDDVATRLYVPRSIAATILNILLQRQLIVPAGLQPAQFRYNPACDSAALMPMVAATYRRQLVALTTFIHSRAPSPVQEFARAFDLKKDR